MKKILSREAVRRIDAATIKRGTPSLLLMENAAAAFVTTFTQLHQGGDVFIICGPGNNGGDGLAIGRMLATRGIRVNLFHLKSDRYSADFEANFKRLAEPGLTSREIVSVDQLPELNERDVIVDALFGTGLNKPLSELPLQIVRWMNAQPATRISIDVPSGMSELPNDEEFVNANHVIAFEVPRVELMLPRVGYNPFSIRFVDIGLDQDAIDEEVTSHFFVEEADVKKLLRKRRMFDHKYTFGHALIVAGSRKTFGAALLATGACMHSGCGLVTLHSIRHGNVSLNALHPEVMFSPDAHDEFITSVSLDGKYNAIGIGCGIGREIETTNALVDVLTKTKLPCVLDADALNILSALHNWKDLIPKGSVLTPHLKEFDRLAGEQPNDHERLKKQTQLAQEIQSTIVVKGPFTRIAFPDGRSFFNSTGTAALATAGTGDVLTGLITGLVARGYKAEDAALIGVYVHGAAAIIAEEKFGAECVIASDVIQCIPETFKRL